MITYVIYLMNIYKLKTPMCKKYTSINLLYLVFTKSYHTIFTNTH